jgi:hypothetical protein
VPELNYQPDGKVLSAFMRSNAFVRGLRGPLGSGKTAACCIEIFRRAVAQVQGPDGRRHFRGVVIRNTQPELKTTTIKTWLDWFPENDWGRFSWQPPFTHMIRAGDLDLEMIFLALDSEEDVKKLYSLEVTMAWVNEARFVPKAVVDVLTGRLRYPAVKDGGITFKGIIMDTNAMDPDHWWPIVAGDVPLPDNIPEEEALMLQKPTNWEFFNQPPAVLEEKSEDGKTRGWKMNPRAENLKYLEPDYYKNQVQGKLKGHILRDLCNQLVVVKEGRAVYESYNEQTHASPEDLQPFAGHPLILGLDFGLTPAAVILQNVRGRWFALDELATLNMGAKAFGQELRRLLSARYPGFHVSGYGDPSGDQRAQTDETTPFQILAAQGLQIFPAPSNDFVQRTEAVDSVLRRMVDGQPGFLVSKKCMHLRKAMAGGYHYPKIKGVDGTIRIADRPSKNMSSHIGEALQYALLGAGEGTNVMLGPPSSRMKVVVKKKEWSTFDRLGRRGKQSLVR